MQTTPISIGGIPALLWGEPTGQLIVAVHGSGSHKADQVIHLLAQEAVPKGYQILSFDLPEHGDRQGQPTLCKVQTCLPELDQVMAYAQSLAPPIHPVVWVQLRGLFQPSRLSGPAAGTGAVPLPGGGHGTAHPIHDGLVPGDPPAA